MSPIRKIVQTNKAAPTLEGAGVHLKRAFGFTTPEQYDPFLLLDDFRSDTPAQYSKGFPWHPHRGIETITYVLKGDVEHGDSLGNSGVISAGDVQWMTAGGGIVHQEMPKGDTNGAMHGFQLWLNLPAKEKMCEPRYRDITAHTIPTLKLSGGAEVRLICGEIGNTTGPVKGISTEPQYLDITLPPSGVFNHATDPSHTAIAYVIGGSGKFSPDYASECNNTTLILYGDGSEVSVRAGDEGVRFLLLCGSPLHEPIAWRGPIVMNSNEELDLAFKEFREGTFLKHDQS